MVSEGVKKRRVEQSDSEEAVEEEAQEQSEDLLVAKLVIYTSLPTLC